MLTLQKVVQLCNMCLHSREKISISLGITRSHVQLFKPTGELLSSHLASFVLNVVRHLLFQCVRYLVSP